MKSVQHQKHEQLASRGRSSLSRVVVWFVVWWLARLPVAVPDFHEVDHHHDHGQQCLYHEHLSRWHEAADTEPVDHDAVLHWHWLIPGEGAGEFGREQPGEAPDTNDPSRTTPLLIPASNESDAFESFLNADISLEKTWICTATVGESGHQFKRGSLDNSILASEINPYFCFDALSSAPAGSAGHEERVLLSRSVSKPMRC